MIGKTILGVLCFFGVAFMLYVLTNFHRESKRGRQANIKADAEREWCGQYLSSKSFDST